mgnify:FL=1
MIKSRYTITQFPDGTHLIQFDKHNKNHISPDTIIWLYESMSEFADVAMIAAHIHEKTSMQPTLIMPYIPNARMDRTKNGEVFTLKYFCQMINAMNFEEVRVFDPHSDVSVALLDRVYIMRQTLKQNILAAIKKSSPDTLYFPDAGALKRYSDYVPTSAPVLYGNKHRDWSTGKILGLDVVGQVTPGMKILMIDDICSYGGTMYYSAQKLKELGAGDISMYISHCENSILDPERGHLFDAPNMIHKVYTTNSIFTGHHDKIEIIHTF